MKIKTYKEMNEKIKELLRLGDDPVSLYAAERIEELEEKERNKMKYYETKHPYYALISARCKDDAISLYVEEVADEEDYLELEDDMTEVTQLEAFIKFAEGIKRSDEDIFTTIGSVLDEFLNTHLLLIDGRLG